MCHRPLWLEEFSAKALLDAMWGRAASPATTAAFVAGGNLTPSGCTSGGSRKKCDGPDGTIEAMASARTMQPLPRPSLCRDLLRASALCGIVAAGTSGTTRRRQRRKKERRLAHEAGQRPGGALCARMARPLALQEGDIVAVVGAGGNVGRLVTQCLCQEGRYTVRAVMRDLEKARAGWAKELPEGCEIFQADTRDYAALATALEGANAVICTTGVPAFGFSGQWEKGNHPESVDHYGVKNAVSAWLSGAQGGVPKRRFVLMSSIGVRRRESFPYVVLNGGGVLDAKAKGEDALVALGKERGFATTIVRPGQLFGGPYENNRYLGTLFQLDKDADTRSVKLEPGDTAVGDTLRSSLAGVLVRCLFWEQDGPMEFSVVNESGPPPSEQDIDSLLAGVGAAGGVGDAPVTSDEQIDKRLGLAGETVGRAMGKALEDTL